MSDKFEKTMTKSQKVLDIFKDRPISFLKYSKKDFAVELQRLPVVQQQPLNHATPPAADLAEYKDLHHVFSKFVGVFHPAKIKAGDKVSTGDIVGNIFSMNINHPVKADKDGILNSFLVEDGQAADYGAKIATIE